MLFQNGLVYLDDCGFHRADVRVKGDRIAEIGEHLSADGEETVDLTGKKLIPGLIDIHTHGCGGYDFTGDASPKALDAMAETYIKGGATRVLVTASSVDIPLLEQSYRTFAAYRKTDYKGARFMGINMECIFLSEAKKGAHASKYLLPATVELFARLQEASENSIKIVVVAPEVGDNMKFIKDASKLAKVFIAHTNATYEQAMEAVSEGAVGFTHLYNAMSGLSHRAPGVVGAAYDSDAFVELICDGLHVLPPLVRLTYKVCADRLCMITDSLMAAGLPDGRYHIGNDDMILKDGICRLPDGTICGSVLNMLEGVRRVMSFGIAEETAIMTASINPARAIGMDGELGSITEGKYADMLVIDPDGYRMEAAYRDGIRMV